MFIYLHGFNSSGESAKGKYFAEQFSEFPFYRPSYPADPDAAIEYLKDYIAERLEPKGKNVLIGTSLGGYYAQYLARHFSSNRSSSTQDKLAIVMINPALDPATTLTPYFGRQTNYYSGEEYYFAEPELQKLLRYDVPRPCDSPLPTLLLLDEGDEIIDYQTSLTIYANCAQCHTFPGGDHQFQHLDKAVSLIRNFFDQKC